MPDGNNFNEKMRLQTMVITDFNVELMDKMAREKMDWKKNSIQNKKIFPL